MRLWCVLLFCFCRFISNLCGESPSGKPVIHPPATEHVLQQGDNLTCIATGGHPQPDELHFHCVNPSLRAMKDEKNDTHIASSITVHRVPTSLNNVRCTCTAVWRGNVTYPDVITVAVYNVEDLPERHLYNPLGLVAGVLGLPFFALVIVLIAVIRRRLHGNTRFRNLRRRWNRRKSDKDASKSTSSDDSDSDEYVLPDDEPISQQQRPRAGVPLLRHQDVEEGEMDGSDATCPCPNAYEPMQRKAQDDDDEYTDLNTQSAERDDVYQNCSAVELGDEGSVVDDDYIPMNVAEC